MVKLFIISRLTLQLVDLTMKVHHAFQSVAILYMYILLFTSSITLRVRRLDGSMLRLTVQSNGTLVDLYKELVRSANIGNSNDFNVIGFGGNYSVDSLQHNTTLLSDIFASSGEIISLENNDKAKVELIASKALLTERSNHRRNGGTISNRRARLSSKRSMTLSDIERHRQSLIRLRRHKVTNTTQVRLAISPQIMLSRLSNTGGVTLLLGKSVKNESASAKASASSTTVAVGGGGAVAVEATMGSIHHVTRAIEICRGDGPFNTCCLDESGVALLQQSIDVAQRLGLDVVGCGIVVPPNKLHELSSNWNAACVHVGLQIHAAAAAANKLRSTLTPSDFIVISVSRSLDTEKKKKKGKGNRLNILQGSSSSTSTGAADEPQSFVAEAYRFSEEALLLKDRGMIINQASTSRASSEMITLTGPVIVSNAEESTSIDSSLLCVPLPIVAWNTPDGEEVEDHWFPSLSEMMAATEDVDKALIAKKYLLKLLGNVRKHKLSAINRLRNPHVLLYLRNVSDQTTLSTLCEYLRSIPSESASTVVAHRMPAELLITLEMIESSLRLDVDDDNTGYS